MDKKLRKKFEKLKKKDISTFIQLDKKIEQLRINPKIGDPMGLNLKGIWHVHIKSFILEYEIDEINKDIILTLFEPHDKAY